MCQVSLSLELVAVGLGLLLFLGGGKLPQLLQNVAILVGYPDCLKMRIERAGVSTPGLLEMKIEWAGCPTPGVFCSSGVDGVHAVG